MRRQLVLVSQHAALMAGTKREALTIADPQANDAILWAASEAVELAEVIRARGGLEIRHGPHGGGLSGGEARRLVLAHALLRRASVLLLDGADGGAGREQRA